MVPWLDSTLRSVDHTKNTFTLSRTQIVFGLTLPLAALLGFMLADPMRTSSLIALLAVMGLVFFPLLIRWHHVFLVFAWNAGICLNFLPGAPEVWMLAAFLSLGFAVAARMVSQNSEFIIEPSLNWAFFALGTVVLLTALATGGVGFSAFGSQKIGGRRYLAIIAAIAGYYALTSRSVPPQRRLLYAGMFFLPGALSLVGSMAYWLGPKFYFLFNLFPTGNVMWEAQADYSLSPTVKRFASFASISPAITSYMLARYGVAGLLNRSHWLRLCVFLIAAFAGLLGGFRFVLVMFGLNFVVYFWLEGLHRTRLLPLLLGLGLLGAAVILPNAERLPLAAQRVLSILPIPLDPIARESAQASIDWRLELWTRALYEVPAHVLLGRGYSLDPNELFFVSGGGGFNEVSSTEGAAYASDYHNGPLSLIIPFGIWGVVAFVWLLVAGLRVLYRNYQFGDESLRTVNGLLFSLFAARAIFFFVVFGSLYSDLALFTGILGLSVALNGQKVARTATESDATDAALSSFAASE